MTALRVVAVTLCVFLGNSVAHAHFVWLSLEESADKKPSAHVYFGETSSADSAEFLDALTRLEVWRRSPDGEYVSVELSKVETDGDGSLTNTVASDTHCVEAECLYGVFSHGPKSMLLHYYAKSVLASATNGLRSSKKLDFDVAPQIENGLLRLKVSWKGKPVKDSQVMVAPPKGAPFEFHTDAEGVVALKAPMAGRYQIRTKIVEKTPGVFEDEKYDELRRYCTVTLRVDSAAVSSSAGVVPTSATESSSSSPTPAVVQASSTKTTPYTDLPRGITSFGAAVIGDWVYVYGGHFGRPHHYSNTSQSDELSRLSLSQPDKWEVIAKGPRLQGLAMVAHGGKLYRVGGFTAHNDEDDDHDLRSVADVERFDPETKEWETLVSLPEPRSSHDVVVMGDKLYVVGGWQLKGDDDPNWHTTAWVLDLAQEKLAWSALPAPNFVRRALSLGHLNGKIYAIGGMREEGGPTKRVDFFDPSNGQWSEGPKLLGKRMDGFGSSAFEVNGRLFVSTYSGKLQCLEGDAEAWSLAVELQDDRFFHRMLPFKNRLIMVGGASMKSGKRLHFESVELSGVRSRLRF